MMTTADMRGDQDARLFPAVIYDDRVTASPVRPVVLRNGVDIEDPLRVVLGLLQAHRNIDLGGPARPASFGEPDLRLANRGGARISAAQIAAILQRRRAIERTLRAIPPGASLAAAADSVPWLPLSQLFSAFADIRGVGVAKMTKALHPKRPALIPLLDSIVQNFLRDDDPGAQAPFAERARARPRLPARPGPQLGGGASGPAGARQARVQSHRGADPRPADLVRPGCGLTGPRLTPWRSRSPPLASGRTVSGGRTVNNLSMQHRPTLR